MVPLTIAGSIGRLLLAAGKGNGLVYVGGCGTGWSTKESVQVRELLDAIPTDRRRVPCSRSRSLSLRWSIEHGPKRETAAPVLQRARRDR